MYIKKKTNKKNPIQNSQQTRLIKVYYPTTYTKTKYISKQKNKHIRGVLRNSLTHPRRGLLQKQSTSFTS